MSVPADCIRFGTINDTVTPANSSGENGFPFPTPVGGDADHPLPITVTQDAFKWWWRVKNWSFSSTWSATFGAIGVTFTNGTMDNSTNAIAVANLWPPSPLANHYFGFPAGTGNSTGALSLFTILGAPTPAFLNTGIYSPAIALSSPSGPTFTRLFDSTNTFFVQFDFNPNNLTNVTGTFVATIDGYNVTCYYDATTSPPTVYNVGTMDFTPQEYWPYAQLIDGLPVYNTTTGAVIPGRDPAN